MFQYWKGLGGIIPKIDSLLLNMSFLKVEMIGSSLTFFSLVIAVAALRINSLDSSLNSTFRFLVNFFIFHLIYLFISFKICLIICFIVCGVGILICWRKWCWDYIFHGFEIAPSSCIYHYDQKFLWRPLRHLSLLMHRKEIWKWKFNLFFSFRLGLAWEGLSILSKIFLNPTSLRKS